MVHPLAVDAAELLGVRAGWRYVHTGILPCNPFRADPRGELAGMWYRSAVAVFGPVITGRQRPRR